MAVIYDIDGNAYNTIVIGSQEWIAENLRTTKYKDGSAIANITDNSLWLADTAGAYCWYSNNIANKTVYGALYNEYAINKANELIYFEDALGVEQSDWRMPEHADFIELQTTCGGWTVAGGLLKETGLTHWNTPNTDAADTYGFKGVPSGIRSPVDGDFYYLGNFCQLATSALTAVNYLYYLLLFYDAASAPIGVIHRTTGLAVRCMRDYIAPTTTLAPTTTAPPMRGVTISHNQPTRVTSTDIIPSVTFVVVPGVDICFEFTDMFISASYKPYTVELSVNKDFTDSVTVPQSKIITYNDRWYHIKRLPKTTNGKVLIGGALYAKINFEDSTKFYDLKVAKTGFKEIIGG